MALRNIFITMFAAYYRWLRACISPASGTALQKKEVQDPEGMEGWAHFAFSSFLLSVDGIVHSKSRRRFPPVQYPSFITLLFLMFLFVPSVSLLLLILIPQIPHSIFMIDYIVLVSFYCAWKKWISAYAYSLTKFDYRTHFECRSLCI